MAKKSAIVSSELTETQKAKVQEIQQSGGTVEITVCKHCGKRLIRDVSIEHESGDLCTHLRDELGYTTETLMAHRATLSGTEVPEGFIKIPDLNRICRKNNIPISRMVNAIGGDRSLGPVADPRLRPIYVGNTRFVDGWAATKEGLAVIANYVKKATKEVPSNAISPDAIPA